MFVDYQTSLDHFKKGLRSYGKSVAMSVLESRLGVTRAADIQLNDFYQKECSGMESCGASRIEVLRLVVEYNWYQCMRPYFNVFPYVENKLLDISASVDFSELPFPFESLEVRTCSETLLCGDLNNYVHVTYQRNDSESYREWMFPKCGTVAETTNRPTCNAGSSWSPNTVDTSLEDDAVRANEQSRVIRIVAGVLALSRDKSLVTPVIMNRHRKPNPDDVYLERAAAAEVHRSGRIGFDVGREMEARKSTEHYRTGHFARFHIGRNHAQYPPGAGGDKVAIIKWRSGCVVNKGNVPEVPTGYHDTGDAEA